VSLPLWKERKDQTKETEPRKPLSLKQIFRIPGIREVMIAFFCGCAMETVVGLWASSYFVVKNQLPADLAASYASLFFIGMTVGRAISGFLTYKLNDTQMIRLGSSLIALGIVVMLLPMGIVSGIVGLVIIGLGCAPVYPCIIHSTPAHFGEENSQAIIGVQMASAYSGVLLLPPLFGLVANYLSAALLPVYLIPVLGMMIWMYEKLVRLHPNC
jgi:fucose permease